MLEQKEIFSLLFELLSEIDGCVVDNSLNRSLIIDKAYNLDNELILKLKDSPKLSNFFFKKIEDVLIFDKSLFQEFISNKQLIEDSFTRFKRKIGFNIKENRNSFSNVVLEWPYKDCILEGTQNNEYENKNEIFWNEVIAKDEIDKLFQPKVISSASLISKDNEISFDKLDESIWDKSNNYLISGNNLIASHTLKEKFRNKIKLVYLDPPYNTPGEANTFSYNNRFNHSTWLTFMKNRLEVSRELLKDEGILCLAIDDNEFAYLKVLADEIFGRENFIATVVVQIKKEGRTDNEFFATSHDYAIFYAKDISKAKILDLPISGDKLESFKEKDKIGHFKWRDFMRTGGNSKPKERPNQYFEFYFSEKSNQIIGVGASNTSNKYDEYTTDQIFIIKNKEIKTISKNEFDSENEYISITPLGNTGQKHVWRWSDREKILNAVINEEIQYVSGKIKIKDRTRFGSKPTTTWYDKEFNATAYGTNLVKQMFDGERTFSYPKSLYTMIDILRVTTDTSSNDIVLDMFAGVGTTAHAVSKLNDEDNGNRSFILIEQMDYVKTATLTRIKKSLGEKTKDFIFFELYKLNLKIIEKIITLNKIDDLIEYLNNFHLNEYLSIHQNLNQIKEKINNKEDFNNIKNLLIETLDKNQIYLSYSEILDKKFNISENVKILNHKFYT